jgi:flavin reductase (DIM6/NTAB) family NADH-FMN oxidoreductase RutF
MTMDDKALLAISCGLYVIGTHCEEGFSGCVVDALIQSTAFPPSVILCSQHQTRTNACIKASGQFSVSVLREDVDPLVVAMFGFQSSRHIQKWNHMPHLLRAGLPVLHNVAAWYVCNVVHTLELATHSMFHGEVIESEKGEGTPLTYGHYRAHMKNATVAAFQAFKKAQAAAAQAPVG